MPRVKRGIIHGKKRRTILKAAKGYKWGRKSKIKLARVAVLKAGQNAYRDRRLKKRDNRQLQQLRINAAARILGTNYSRFIGMMHKAGATLDRKVLSQIAADYPEVFKKILEAIK